MWPPSPAPAASGPGYLGIRIRDFYRQRFCMHALTIQGVEVAAVDPESPAARAGLRPARGLSAREIAAATIAGLLTISPASSLAAPVLRAAGGVGHGDIILALNGRRVKTQHQFQQELARFGPHAVVHLTIRRDEATVQLPVRLEEWPGAGLTAAPLQTSARFSH
ncbi:MAG: PDZ domain-containing protein [Candidatus Binatia bacterium]|nr:PDZ domain-containing protein [Candidatus Binatia bacterium]